MSTAANAGRSVGDRIWAQLAEVTGPIETAASLPPAFYSDDACFQAEREQLFHRSWFSVGRADRWKTAGDFTADDYAGVPTIILRDRDGALRAFSNSCRHRGTQLLEGEGCARAITCPFHSWTYGLDGAFRGAPGMEALSDADRASLALVPFRIEERDGFAYLCFNADAPPLDHCLGDFSEIHAPWSLGELVTTHRREFEVACNWKPFLEVFSEWYHLPYVHSDSIDELYAKPDLHDEVRGDFTTQFGQTEGRGGLLKEKQDHAFPMIPSLAGRNRQGGRYSWVFPNLVFSANPDGLWLYEAYPLAPDRARIVFSFCFPPVSVALPDFEARAEGYYERLRTAVEEDIPMLERQQRGLNSPYGQAGRFCKELEPMVAEFALWYAQRLSAAQPA